MFKIKNGRSEFFQWDLNQQLIVEDDSVNEVHFSNKTDDYSLVCEVYESDGMRLVNVPNILLQTGISIRVYGYYNDYTKVEEVFKVHRRAKPEDYIYTETEVKSYEALDVRIKVLEDKPAEINAEDVTQIVKDNFVGGVGYEETIEGVLLPETSFEYVSGDTIISYSFPYTFEIGKEYTVTFDGETNTYTAIDYNKTGMLTNTSFADVVAGNGWVIMAGDGGVLLQTLDSSLVGAHTISISGAVTNIYKIDEKYLGEITFKMDKMNPVGEGTFSLNRQANTDIGEYSFAEGQYTTASGSASHAEGYHTTASGESSHAEGSLTTAIKEFSHAEGFNTIAASESQHVQGKYNVKDSNRVYAHIIGGGTGNTNRKNIHTVDWNGNAWYAGNIEGKALIIASSTAGSSKRFKITVNDSGTLTATEVRS